MTRQLTEWLETLEVTEPESADGMQVFGLRWNTGDAIPYRTLDEALATQELEVSEVSDGGTVPTLQLKNKGDTLVFLMSGEQLVGAKQNRVLNTSLLVAAKSELPIPVSCVEAGRWAYRSRQFGSHGTSSHSTLRKMMTKQVQHGYESTGTPTSNQSEVWTEIDRKLCAMQTASGTRALEDTYTKHAAPLENAVKRLSPPEGCSGVVFAFAGQIVGVDLFDRPETLQKLWPKLMRAYAIDALESETPTAITREAVADWIHQAARAEAKPFKSPGLGDDVRLRGPTVIGAGLMVEEHPVHVGMFAETAPA